MKLYGVRLFVDELEVAKRFYLETLGLPLAWDLPEAGAFGAALDGGQLIVERIGLEADPEDLGLIGRFVGLSLQVDDIQKSYENLKAKGVVFTEPPTQQLWGGWLAHFKDPAGNVLTLLG